jgi:acyl dehydratase
MPIDLALAKTATPQTSTVSWDEDRVILYHLGLGAGLAQPTDAKELEYTYEGNLKVLPSFAVVPTFGALAAMTGFPGIDVNFALVLHGEQDVELHRPIPTAAEVENVTRLAGVYDKGKAALIVLEVETRHRGEPLFTNRFSIFARGEGGFGGEGGPKPGNEAPSRDPDATFESPTLPNQALLYRLSGDKNPLHADPAFAALGGFDKPILHGLCTFGVVCKAVVDGMLGGDVTKVARYQVRFAGVVYPGETIVTSAWREGDRILVGARTKERGQPVLSNAAITLR